MERTNKTTPQTFSQVYGGETTAENFSEFPKEAKSPFVPKEAICFHTNSWDYRVYAAKLTDGTFQTVAFYIVDVKGHVSDTVFKKRSQLMKRNGFEFIYDLEGDFDKADLDKIKAGYKNVEEHLKAIHCPEKLPFELVYKGLYQCRNRLKDDLITIDRDGDLEYLCIDTKCFDAMVKAEDCGWKALEVKKVLRQLGFLRINFGRPYDFAKRDKDGSTYRTISLRLDKALGEEAEV